MRENVGTDAGLRIEEGLPEARLRVEGDALDREGQEAGRRRLVAQLAYEISLLPDSPRRTQQVRVLHYLARHAAAVRLLHYIHALSLFTRAQ